MVFDPERSASDATTALASVCAIWLENAGTTDFKALRLAPPVLEAWAPRGRLLSREAVDFRLDWPLPVADGVQPGIVRREHEPAATRPPAETSSSPERVG